MELATIGTIGGVVLGFVTLIWVQMERLRESLENQIRYLGEQIGQVRNESSKQFNQLRSEVAEFRTEVAEEFGKVRAEVAEQFGEVRAVQERHTQQLSDITRNLSEQETRVGRLEGFQMERAATAS